MPCLSVAEKSDNFSQTKVEDFLIRIWNYASFRIMGWGETAPWQVWSKEALTTDIYVGRSVENILKHEKQQAALGVCGWLPFSPTTSLPSFPGQEWVFRATF